FNLMFSQQALTNILFFSFKSFLTMIIIIGVLLGYQERMFGFSMMVVGFCLIGQSTQKMVQNRKVVINYEL
ncbi:MAG: hypothetical protein AB4041_20300, partial [Microcystaceae cyanobacterium]